jgi:hypothetical protein
LVLAQQAAASLQLAVDGVQQIADALDAGIPPPDAARQQVADGLAGAVAAVQGIQNL